jgi:hypothetical protein
MSTIPKIRSKETEMISSGSHKKIPSKKLPVKNIFSNIQSPVITDPIDSKRISKVSFSNSLNVSSVVKAGLVFLGTVGSYYLAKTTGIFSYFGWGTKNQNSKDVGNSEIMELKNSANALTVKTNLETARRANTPSLNHILQTYKVEDGTVEFEEIKVEEFNDFPKIKEKDVGMRRSILNPTFKGSYDTFGRAEGIALSGNYAYIANYYSGLQIIDISDPSNPTFKGSSATPGEARGVALSGNYAYIASYHSGLQIIDISDPSNPTFKGSYAASNRVLDVAVSENYAYVADQHLEIIDITNPSNPTFKGVCYAFEARGIALSGNYAYVGDLSKLRVIDISDPSNPTFKGSYDVTGNPWRVAVSGNYSYVTAWNYGLQIIDVTDPSNPTFKSSYDTPGDAFGIALSGNYAYVAAMGSGLQIIDVSNPANPTFSCSYDTPGSAYGIALSGNYAYVADESSLQIIALGLETDLTVTFIIVGAVTGAVCISSFCFLALIIGGGVLAIRRNRNKTVKNENNEDTKNEELKEESAKV